MVFLNLDKAHDRANWERVYHGLENEGIPSGYAEIIRRMHAGVELSKTSIKQSLRLSILVY